MVNLCSDEAQLDIRDSLPSRALTEDYVRWNRRLSALRQVSKGFLENIECLLLQYFRHVDTVFVHQFNQLFSLLVISNVYKDPRKNLDGSFFGQP